MKKIVRIALAMLLLTSLASAAALTNADIIKMFEAKLDESIILTAIESAPASYDTSPQGLIALSSAKLPPAIIAALIKKNSPPAAGKPAAPTIADGGPAPTVATETIAPSEVFMIDGTQTVAMRYLNPQMRTAARGLGFGGVASYAVLRGSQANSRITNKRPVFLVSVPNQAQPESYVTVASFAVRKNNSREVLVGGGYMSYSSGIHPDRIMAVTSEKAADQSKAQKGFTLYKVTSSRDLPTGEYAVILYTGEMQSAVATWFTGTGNSYFDFGVDP
jgi:hypothetical protein